MRGLFLASHDADLDLGEPGVLEHLVKLGLRETEPHVGVKLAGLFVAVGGEVEDDDAAAIA